MVNLNKQAIIDRIMTTIKTILIVAMVVIAGCSEQTEKPVDTTAAAPEAKACEFCGPGDADTAADATANAIQKAVEVQRAAEAATATAGARATQWYEPADRDVFDLDLKVTDQQGTDRLLSEYLGKPIALSFIFTRCSNPRMCPTITVTMARLQRDLAKAGLADKTRVLLISYDPVYDTPQRLKKYAEDRGFRFDHGAILRPDVDQYSQLLSELSVSTVPLADGTFNHAMELLIIDHLGRFVRDYRGSIWDNKPVLDDLHKLVQEQQNSELPQATEAQ